MTSEEPKHPKKAGTSSQEQPGEPCHGDDSRSAPAIRDGSLSRSGSDTDDRWNDSDIEAAIGVLERPSQPPSSMPPSRDADCSPDVVAPMFEGPCAAPSASFVEKSKRGKSDPPGGMAASSPTPRFENAGRDKKEAALEEPAKTSKAGTRADPVRNGSGNTDESDPEEATQYFDPALRLSPSSTKRSEPSAPISARAKALPNESTAADIEEATRFFDRGLLVLPDAAGVTEADEATQFLDRVSLSAAQDRRAVEGVRAANTVETGSPKSTPRPGVLPPLPQIPPLAMDRVSSISLGKGIALLSAETTEPPPVVDSPAKSPQGRPIDSRIAEAASGNPQIVSRSKPLPPRPDFARKVPAGGNAPFDLEPVSSLETELPTRPVNEGTVQPSPAVSRLGLPGKMGGHDESKGAAKSVGNDAEPQSERSSEGAGAEVELAAQGLTGVTAFSIAPRPGSAGFEEEVWLDPFVVRAGRRWLLVTASCVLAVLAISPLEAWYARRSAADHPGFLQLLAASAGLLVPLAMAIAFLVSGFSMMVHPDNAPSIAKLPQHLRPQDARRQARLAVILAIAPLAMACWVVAVARAALPLLGSGAPTPVVGILLSSIAVGFGLLMAAPVLAVARYVGVRLRQHPPDPIRWGLVGIVAGTLPLVLAIALGPTSGAGSALAVFGVFRRPELDLRAPAMLMLIVFTGYLLPNRLQRLSLIWAILIAVLPLGLTFRAAVRGLETRAIALAIERGAPLSRVSLGRLRRLTDRDGDGFSKYFGGGDCDDRDRNRNPAQDDLPENGRDEDCSGSDAAAITVQAVASTPVEVLRERRASIPDNLNLIFIIVDTMRADTLFHPRHVTPRLDELAERSVVVKNAYAPASYTGKSVGPILIGKHSSETNRDFGHFSAFAKKDTFVQQRLQLAGMRTLSVQGYWYFYQPPYGFERGFDVVDSTASTGTGYVEGDRTSTSEKLTDRILQQLERSENTSSRFFLWAQFTDPHSEYVSHSGFDFGSDSLSKYHGEVAFVDHHIGRIIDLVRSRPWGARTAVIVTSDHGESFGEHGMIRHGFEIWEPLVRVPLIMHVPGIAPRHVNSRRSLVDLVPTMLDLLQVAEPEPSGTDFLSGRSLLPEMLGIDGSDVARPVMVDMAQGPFTAERQAYIDGDHKLIAATGRPVGLYDLSADPDEKRDLLDDAPLRERMVGAYRAYRKAMHVIDVRAKP